MYKDYSRIGLTVDDDELEAMIQAAAAKAESAARTKGATRQQLAGREDMALKMLRSNLSLREQQKIWEATGIQTTAPSLRAYFKRYFAEEWAAYLSRTARGQLKNRLLAEPGGAEKAEIEAFLAGKSLQPQVEPNNKQQPAQPQVEASKAATLDFEAAATPRKLFDK